MTGFTVCQTCTTGHLKPFFSTDYGRLDEDMAERMSAMKTSGEDDMAYFERRYQERVSHILLNFLLVNYLSVIHFTFNYILIQCFQTFSGDYKSAFLSFLCSFPDILQQKAERAKKVLPLPSEEQCRPRTGGRKPKSAVKR